MYALADTMEQLQGVQFLIITVRLQGFVQFRVRGEPVHLDVDRLNEQLQAAGKNRLRQFMRPDEGLGVIISFDNVVCPKECFFHKLLATFALSICAKRRLL